MHKTCRSELASRSFDRLKDREASSLLQLRGLHRSVIELLAGFLLDQRLLDRRLMHFIGVFLAVRSVGVMGDGRKYDWVVSLRAVETIDFMTAHWAHLPYDFLGRVSNRIINEVNGISRVVYDISGKPPATIEWE